uniref:Leucine-rich repeat-containing protein 2 n=1 Tax=Knipowitschia caucasica TaxID=637954 RepID=A0AAV2MP70_KNICA
METSWCGPVAIRAQTQLPSRPPVGGAMGVDRRRDVPVYDLSVIRGLWEGRASKQRVREKRERERREKSALARIEQQWQYRIYCKTLKRDERNALQRYLERSPNHQPGNNQPGNHTDIGADGQSGLQTEPDPENLVFRLEGDKWMSFPKELQWMTYLKEWHVSHTRIQRLPEFFDQFSKLSVLNLAKNQICEVPADIGKLRSLKQLDLSYNRLMKVPVELGDCEELERLELAGNHLCELPFELSSLKQLHLLDVSENSIPSVPVCVLRMESLNTLDLSNNRLRELPQDMDRLENLVTLFLHKNPMSYLPHCLTNISGLKMVIVSGDELNCIPTRICSNPDIKFIRLYDSPTQQQKQKEEEAQRKRRWKGAEEQRDSSEKEFLQAYVSTLTHRESVPYSTTKISISCQL